MGSVFFFKAPSQRPGFNPPDSILTRSLGFIYTGTGNGWAGPFWNGRQSQGSLKVDCSVRWGVWMSFPVLGGHLESPE